MPRLPRVSPADLLRALRKDGWQEIGQEGSHVQLKHPSKRGKVTVGVHSGKTIPPSLLKSIMRQAGLTAEDLRDLL
jgi:predicted RNA binding protein YcfA (HicA-like mRNA interferase family)